MTAGFGEPAAAFRGLQRLIRVRLVQFVHAAASLAVGTNACEHASGTRCGVAPCLSSSAASSRNSVRLSRPPWEMSAAATDASISAFDGGWMVAHRLSRM